MNDQKSLYERLGGYDAIAAVANSLLPRLMADPALGRFWAHRGEDGINREKQLLIDFLCANAGGPLLYTGRDMVSSHKGMRISDSDWEALVGHLRDTLDSFSVPEQEAGEVLAFIESTRAEIVEAQRPVRYDAGMAMTCDSKEAFQDLIPDNHCFGCGPDNEAGLRIKSYWTEPGQSICRFRPAPHHTAGAEHVLNGGIICTVIDCHSVCTAVAAGYAAEGRPIGTGDGVWFATGSIAVRYHAPAPVGEPVELEARIVSATGKKMKVACTLSSHGATCAEATVIAVRVSAQWQHGRKR